MGSVSFVVALADLIEVLDAWYPPAGAEPWDAVGLVVGDPAAAVRRVHVAVDCVPETVAEAVRSGAQMLLTHHPLLLGGVSTVAADTPKGAMVHRLIEAGVALFVAHTNADVARPGVSDALAERLGLAELRPLRPQTPDAAGILYKLIVFVPTASTTAVIDAVAAAGAGQLGDYDRCAWTTTGVGTFRPGPDAHPAIGAAGRVESVAETRVEMVLAPDRLPAVLAAMRAAHPYEEPAYDVFAHVAPPRDCGTGRVGVLAETTTVAAFAAQAAAALPATAWGLRVAGDPGRPVRVVAVCGGSGATYIPDAQRAGADLYLTADLKHHTVVEAVTERGRTAMALVDAAHWATEAPWVDAVAARLRDRFGTTVDITTSATVTDPWTDHYPAPNRG